MSRSCLAVGVFVLLRSAPLIADGPQHPQVRGLDAWARESIARGLTASPLVQELVRRLEASDLIVHVESRDALPRGVGGMTRFISLSGGVRYARVTLDRTLYPDVRAATLAHELQHAWELASSGASTRHEVAALYQQIGFRISGKQPLFYETQAAERAGTKAWEELRGYPGPHRNGQ